MKKILSDIFLKFPEGKVKNVIRLGLYKAAKKKFFTITYSWTEDIWIVKEGNIQLKFKKTPYHVFSTNPLFLKFFPKWSPDIIVDAGAFHGTVSIYLAKKYPTAKVLMLEPDPASFKTLSENVRLNGLTNVELYKKGLWNTNGVIHFQQGNELGSAVVRKKEENAIAIETITPDTLLNNCSGKRIFFKINIEGAELEVLPACLSLYQKNIINMAVATDHLINGEFTYIQTEALCELHRMPFKTEHIGIYKTTYIEERKEYRA